MIKAPPPYHINMLDIADINEHCTVYWFDREHRLLGCNQYQANMLLNATQKKLEQVIGQKLNELFPSEHIKLIENENNLVLQTGKAHKFFNIIKFPNYQTIQCITVKTPLYNKRNEIVGVFGITHIISVYRHMEEMFERLTKREYECLLLLLKSKLTKEIAAKMHLSIRTVEHHIDNIKTKLGCKTKAALHQKVMQVGLIALQQDEFSISDSFEPGVFFVSSKKI